METGSWSVFLLRPPRPPMYKQTWCHLDGYAFLPPWCIALWCIHFNTTCWVLGGTTSQTLQCNKWGHAVATSQKLGSKLRCTPAMQKPPFTILLKRSTAGRFSGRGGGRYHCMPNAVCWLTDDHRCGRGTMLSWLHDGPVLLALYSTSYASMLFNTIVNPKTKK